MCIKDIAIIFSLSTYSILSVHSENYAKKQAEEYSKLIGNYKTLLDVGEAQHQEDNTAEILNKLTTLMNNFDTAELVASRSSSNDFKILDKIPPPPSTTNQNIIKAYNSFLKQYAQTKLGEELLKHPDIYRNVSTYYNLYTQQLGTSQLKENQPIEENKEENKPIAENQSD